MNKKFRKTNGEAVVKPSAKSVQVLRQVLQEQAKSGKKININEPGGVPVYKRGPNDPSWRTSNKLSTALAATLPFFNPNGLKIDAANQGSNCTVIVPGVMRISVLVTVGNATDYNSPVNLAARRTFSRTVMKNSRTKTYDAVDQMIYFIAMEQAYALCGWLQRLYRVINKFSATDRFQPRTLVVAMQVNYDDIKKHQAELAWLIRWMGNALNSLAVPKTPIFTAAYDAFRHIYTDDSSPRKQIYLLDAYNFGTYNPTYDTNGGGVSFDGGADKVGSWASHGLLTYDEIYTMVHDVMDPIMGDDDIGVIAGDIMKAYDESELFKVEADSMEIIDLEYSEEILQQVHNLRTLSTGFAVFNGYKQLPGATNTAPYLVADLNFSSPATGGALPRKFDIDAFSDNPSPEEIVNCTALQARINWKIKPNVTPATVEVLDCCFDLLAPREVELYLEPAGTTYTYSFATEYSDIYLLGSLTANAALRRTLNFDWAPFAYGETNSSGDGSIAPIGDVRMIGFFDYSVHQRIHENSVLNLFELLEN